jgi:hypothetical protein
MPEASATDWPNLRRSVAPDIEPLIAVPNRSGPIGEMTIQTKSQISYQAPWEAAAQQPNCCPPIQAHGQPQQSISYASQWLAS